MKRRTRLDLPPLGALGFLAIAFLVIVGLACSGANKATKLDPVAGAGAETPAATTDDSEFAGLITRSRIFTGAGGVRVTLVELEGDEEALIQVTGTQSSIEGKVIKHEIRRDGAYTAFITRLYARTHWTVVRNQGRITEWRLNPIDPGDESVLLTLDNRASRTMDAIAIYREYERQVADGSLEAVKGYSREVEKARLEVALAREAERVRDQCKLDLGITVAWDTISDELLGKQSLSSPCSKPFEAVREICTSQPARDFLARNLQSVQCRIGDRVGFERDGKTATWTVTLGSGIDLDDFIGDKLVNETYRGNTLRYHMQLAATHVCLDSDNQRYIVLAPSDTRLDGLLYGDGKTFYRARPHPTTIRNYFYEPRFYNPRNPNRSVDLRPYSHLGVAEELQRCRLMCGTHATDFELLPTDRAVPIIEGAMIKPSPLPREPYALARDDRGVYYYVDRSTKPGQSRDFQLYAGKLGALRLQRMKDIVSDSEGEIFVSRKGKLRLILDRSKASWIRGNKRTELTLIPIDQNLQMIYNNLGPYMGKRLGNPCDDYGME